MEWISNILENCLLWASRIDVKSIFMSFMFLRLIAIIFLDSIKWLVFVMEAVSLLWGRNSVYNYYLHEFQASKCKAEFYSTMGLKGLQLLKHCNQIHGLAWTD
jgi:hypothetical protein